ncbi:ethanolamine permease [Rhodospirillum rubrum]|uniref:Amino acid permease-associated region n=1 Tax=Rhodospirillum rubrum (strain ATCC 11170 / ATH 1.1.1 / DSM 467 / LMG 4362 / NCIMB 8255 / S1) TaxID=269796 RepID=Q2RVL4_RHORT|nr:ethanolamine permease [Rhodospirillum rubrum]ABC21831.1 Amino acid permease-associated region [Rhodospirillum rubrum ATCC 11170]AEO47531.1 amino acid permease-associated region [Rhodospirillum rubrum F11]MBK5953388.1 ethanolamine permease [Rhodospirillum rubrum]QXG81492.1 ethanolamine permease [Rhodospirillum rubrum]HAP99585.1 ethanolamine permease [Rhodospirillum rubrum]
MTLSIKPTLKKSLSGLHLWGIAVGLVISGEYFGWSYGWDQAGTLGFLVTTILIAVMYTTFIFSFTELTTAIPHAGGPFAYSYRAFGPLGGFLAGFATLIEFVFAPPAISLAIGAYLNVQFPGLDPKLAAVGAYVVFMALNIAGVTIAATFELLVTVLAIAELLVFMGVVSPGFSFTNFVANGWSGESGFSFGSLSGIFAAIPFAIWFFLAIEGAAMAAEETKDPRTTVPKAYIAGILTLVFLAFGTMIFAGGVGDWKALSNINDPLPQAMKVVVGESSGWLHMLVWIGLFGLIASFHGIIMGYSRQIFALARAGFLPAVFSTVHPSRKTPHWAILAGGVIGIAAIFSDSFISIGGLPLTANIVTMSVFGAIVMYIMSMAALFRLRQSEPALDRPFRAPFYPVFPAIALAMAVVALITMIYFNPMVFGLFVGLMAAGWLFYRFTAHLRAAAPGDGLLSVGGIETIAQTEARSLVD